MSRLTERTESVIDERSAVPSPMGPAYQLHEVKITPVRARVAYAIQFAYGALKNVRQANSTDMIEMLNHLECSLDTLVEDIELALVAYGDTDPRPATKRRAIEKQVRAAS